MNDCKKMKDKVYTYMVECSDGTLYTGWTSDLYKRMNTHNKGKGAKYTRSRIPVKLVYYEMCDNKSEALKREIEIKRMKRKEKLEIIKNFNLKKEKSNSYGY